MPPVSVDVAVAQPAELGESPVWCPDHHILWWVDIEGRAIHRFNPSTGVDEKRPLPGRPGSLARASDPNVVLVAIEHELVWFDWSTGHMTPWLTLEAPGVGIRMNDGRTDPAGRFVVGSMFENTRAGKRVGSLHQVSADGTVRRLRAGVGTSNGLAFDADRHRMYWADTADQRVWSFSYDPADGEPVGETLFLDYHELNGKPDGACVDVDGCYWSACVRGWAVIRVTPDGTIDRRIDVPVAKPTMPAFGNAGLDTLFVTSIAGNPADARDGVAPGALLAIDTSALGVRGRTDPPFAGTPPVAAPPSNTT